MFCLCYPDLKTTISFEWVDLLEKGHKCVRKVQTNSFRKELLELDDSLVMPKTVRFTVVKSTQNVMLNIVYYGTVPLLNSVHILGV